LVGKHNIIWRFTALDTCLYQEQHRISSAVSRLGGKVTDSYQYQLLPSLSEDEYASLKADIQKRGVQVPVEYDELGNILDGHHRVQICQELGIKDWPSIVRVGMSEADKIDHVLALNLDRRHLSREQRKELVVKLREMGWSLRRIGDKLNVSDVTVLRDLSGATIVAPGTVAGSDGKSYPSQRTSVMVKNRGEAKRLTATLSEMNTETLPDRVMDVKRVERISREQRAEQRGQAVTGDSTTSNIELLLGDFRERGKEIADQSVDLILTDPPYPREFLPLWSNLSTFAARVLKPNGMLITYTGAMDLPEVIARLSESLTYWWCGAVILGGPQSRVYARNIAQGVKPLLFFVPAGYKSELWLEDHYSSEGKEKDTHDWQQSIGLALHFIEKLCPIDGMIVDPFMGGGTTMIAAKQLRRRGIGIEIDAASFGLSQERIMNDN
jgi:16S rRNA G966 N2-methylase RsmD